MIEIAPRYVAIAAVLTALSASAGERAPSAWPIHDRDRPLPPVVDPGAPSTQESPGRPPSDATVLFDGKDLSGWRSVKGGPARGRSADGYLEVVKGAGAIETVRPLATASSTWSGERRCLPSARTRTGATAAST